MESSNLPGTDATGDRDGGIGSLPRRQHLEFRGPVWPAPSNYLERFDVSRWYVAFRAARWAVTLLGVLVFFVWAAVTVRRGRKERVGRYLARALERMGATGIKIGQSLSMRADLIDPVYCDAVAHLLDRVEPLPDNAVVAILESAYGRRIEELFRVFDPNPIGSASIACVYQAELRTGERVAVKVRRPGIGERIQADTKALILVTRLAEQFGILAEGPWTSFSRELRKMLLEEPNFRQEARYTEIFRREAAVNDFVTAPKVYYDYCRKNIIVTEFVSGAFLSEFIAARESNDEQALQAFAERGFDLALIARRIMELFFWELFESDFFHADPHPQNIIVRPDNTLVMIDFGSCGTMSHRFRRSVAELYSCILRDDIGGMCRSMLALNEPLGAIDVNACMEAVSGTARDWLFAAKSEYATWEEKCTGRALMVMLGEAGKYGVKSTPEAVRFFKAGLLYDSIAFRIDPRLETKEAYRSWFKRYSARTRRRVLESAGDRITGPRDEDFVRWEQFVEVNQRLLTRLETFLDQPRFSFNQGVSKVAYVVSTAVKTGANAVGVLVLISLIRFLWQSSFELKELSSASGVLDAVSWSAGLTVYQVWVAVLVVIFLRKAVMKLDTVEIGA